MEVLRDLEHDGRVGLVDEVLAYAGHVDDGFNALITKEMRISDAGGLEDEGRSECAGLGDDFL